MTPHAAFVRLPWQTYYRCTTCRARVAPSARIAHLNEETTRAGLDGTRTAPALEDDE